MLKKKFYILLAAILLVASFPPEALACTAIYAGAELTEDGSTIFARLEEYYSAREGAGDHPLPRGLGSGAAEAPDEHVPPLHCPSLWDIINPLWIYSQKRAKGTKSP